MAELTSHVDIGCWHDRNPERVDELIRKGWTIDVHSFIPTHSTRLRDESYTVWILRKPEPTLLEAGKKLSIALRRIAASRECEAELQDFEHAIDREERKERDAAIQ